MRKKPNNTVTEILTILRELHANYPNQSIATHIVLACGDMDCMENEVFLACLESYKICKDMDTSNPDDEIDYFNTDEDSFPRDDNDDY